MKLKKIISILLSLTLTISIFPVSIIIANAESYSGTCGDNLTWSLDTDTGLLKIEGTGEMYDYFNDQAPWSVYKNSISNVNLADEITKIGNSAFWGCGEITDIDIPNKVIGIGDYAFSYCRKLADIQLPATVKSIGGWAFNCCPITQITIPEGVESIGWYAFGQDNSLTTVTIPKSVTDLSPTAFVGLDTISVAEDNPKYHSSNNCVVETDTKTLITGTNSGIIPDNGEVEIIGDHAFYNCVDITEIDIPEGVTEIGWYAFMECLNLKTIVLPASLTSLNSEAFDKDCLELIYIAEDNTKYYSAGNCVIDNDSKTLVLGIQTSVIPENGEVEIIGENAFTGCYNLTEIAIPNTVKVIEHTAFDYCISLKSVTIPESVEKIEYYAFGRCWSLATVTIQANGLDIVESAFYGCENLKTVNNYSKMLIKSGSETYGGVAYYADVVNQYCIFDLGDINADDGINLNDVAVLAQYIAGWNLAVGDDYNELALDVNGDGFVNLNDVSHLAQYIAGWQGIVLH